MATPPFDESLLVAPDFINVRMVLVDALGWGPAVVLQRIYFRCAGQPDGGWPATTKEIAAECRMSEKTTQRHLVTLREAGWLHSARRSSWDATLVWRVGPVDRVETADLAASETAVLAVSPSVFQEEEKKGASGPRPATPRASPKTDIADWSPSPADYKTLMAEGVPRHGIDLCARMYRDWSADNRPMGSHTSGFRNWVRKDHERRGGKWPAPVVAGAKATPGAWR